MGRSALLAGATLGAVLVSATSAQAADFYVDPASGSATGEGSSASPWQTLEQVVGDGKLGSTVGGGDTVWLRSGYHGELVIRGGDNATPITIAAEPGHSPRLSRAAFDDTAGWVLKGVSISPSHAPAYERGTIVDIGSSSNLVVEGNQVFSVEDASGWSAGQWVDEASNGFEVGGSGVVVRNNTVKNVRFGISVGGENALVEYNQVVNYSADGLRGLGNGTVFQYNVVKNSYVGDDQDENHDDGFQSWSVGDGGVGTGEVRGIVLRGNYFINSEDPDQPLKGTLQGVGCFDGFFVDWVVENNVVITNHWHGITFLGMRDSRIVNNTVIDNSDGQPGPPWIMVNPHKDGRPSANVTIRNNLATDFDLAGDPITDDHNVELDGLDAYFVAPATFDLHLLPGSPAIDQGSLDLAPELDIERIRRPQGAGVDLGAYEWHDPSVGPEDGGATGGTTGSGGTGTGGTGTGGTGTGTGGTGTGGQAGGAQGSGGSRVGISDSGDDSGCSCGVVSGRADRHALLLWASGLLLALSGAACRRRQRSIRVDQPCKRIES
jgi:hypothetical protein